MKQINVDCGYNTDQASVNLQHYTSICNDKHQSTAPNTDVQHQAPTAAPHTALPHQTYICSTKNHPTLHLAVLNNRRYRLWAALHLCSRQCW